MSCRNERVHEMIDRLARKNEKFNVFRKICEFSKKVHDDYKLKFYIFGGAIYDILRGRNDFNDIDTMFYFEERYRTEINKSFEDLVRELEKDYDTFVFSNSFIRMIDFSTYPDFFENIKIILFKKDEIKNPQETKLEKEIIDEVDEKECKEQEEWTLVKRKQKSKKEVSPDTEKKHIPIETESFTEEDFQKGLEFYGETFRSLKCNSTVMKILCSDTFMDQVTKMLNKDLTYHLECLERKNGGPIDSSEITKNYYSKSKSEFIEIFKAKDKETLCQLKEKRFTEIFKEEHKETICQLKEKNKSEEEYICHMKSLDILSKLVKIMKEKCFTVVDVNLKNEICGENLRTSMAKRIYFYEKGFYMDYSGAINNFCCYIRDSLKPGRTLYRVSDIEKFEEKVADNVQGDLHNGYLRYIYEQESTPIILFQKNVFHVGHKYQNTFKSAEFDKLRTVIEKTINGCEGKVTIVILSRDWRQFAFILRNLKKKMGNNLLVLRPNFGSAEMTF